MCCPVCQRYYFDAAFISPDFNFCWSESSPLMQAAQKATWRWDRQVSQFQPLADCFVSGPRWEVLLSEPDADACSSKAGAHFLPVCGNGHGKGHDFHMSQKISRPTGWGKRPSSQQGFEAARKQVIADGIGWTIPDQIHRICDSKAHVAAWDGIERWPIIWITNNGWVLLQVVGEKCGIFHKILWNVWLEDFESMLRHGQCQSWVCTSIRI